jgi:hypothetical protein
MFGCAQVSVRFKSERCARIDDIHRADSLTPTVLCHTRMDDGGGGSGANECKG